MSERRIFNRGPIAWMAGNSVAANILMLFFLVGGVIWGLGIKQEVFPEYDTDEVSIVVAYPGASPEEVEQGVILAIEEAIQDIDGIKRVSSTANEGSASVSIEVIDNKQLKKVYEDVKNAVDRITTFPEDVEDPIINIPSHSRKVITPVVYGNVSTKVLREYAELVRDQLLSEPNITLVELLGERPLEIKIDVDLENLRKYDLNISDISDAIRNNSKDVPAGKIKTDGGEILLRFKEKKYRGTDFENIPVKFNPDGAILYLRDVAKITDDFQDNDVYLEYNGMPAIGIKVYRVGKQTPIDVADTVKKHVALLEKTLPAGVNITYVDDASDVYRQRINLLLKNGYFGLILVFILLGLFLELRLAFWVTLGIPISFLGTLIFLPFYDVSINMISLFAFIISLGIVVDDAIVVGENIYQYKQNGMRFKDAAIKGAKDIATPVIFSIITNVVTFMPMFFIPGTMGKIFWHIPAVVVTVFLISLLESLFILPAHLGHQKDEYRSFIMKFIGKYQQKFSRGFESFVRNIYGPALVIGLKFRYLAIVSGIAVLLLALTYVKTGRMGFTLFPIVESDLAYVGGTLPTGSPVSETVRVKNYFLKKAQESVAKNGGDKLSTGILSFVSANTFWIQVYLTPPEVRPISTGKFVDILREESGQIAGLDTLMFRSDFGGPGSGPSLTIQLVHRDTEILESAATELAKVVAEYPLVTDVDNGFTPGKRQIDIKLKPLGYQLGFNPSTLGRELRNRYYGNEVISQQRGRNEIKVTVRLDERERGNLNIFENMIVKSPKGYEIPLKEISEIKYGRAYTSISRRDFKKVVTVSADVNPRRRTQEIISDLKANFLPKLLEKYSGLSYSLEGKEADRRESTDALMRGLLYALLGIYVILAIPFKSYIQPLIVMISIPFGIIGAIIGHVLMGYSLSLISIMGIVALSGVVVNDSLVLIDLANRKVLENIPQYRAVVEAGIQRFRPIVLTTLTTFFGLMPMIFETSRQARFLIPMAISLGFGILFATVITLGLVPCLYIVIEDIKYFLRRIF